MGDFQFVLLRLPGHFHYREEDIVVLLDDQDPRRPRQQPTKANIVRPSCSWLTIRQMLKWDSLVQVDAIRWLVSGAQPNDSLFFHCEFDS